MKCWVKGRTMYFDAEAVAVIKQAAKKEKKTFRQIVLEALKRGVKSHVEEVLESKQVSRRSRPQDLAVVKKEKGVS